MEERAMVVSILWVPKGASKKIPKEYDLDEDEIEELKQEMEKEKAGKDNDIEDDDEEVMPGFSEVGNKKDMEFIESNYEKDFVDVEEFSEEEKEDYTIKKTDAVVVAAKIEKGYSCLEVCIYEEHKCNLFQHHEVALTDFPLCMEWLPINPKTFQQDVSKKGNFVIVGSFLPEIEIWDLDVVNSVTPKMTLGGSIQDKTKKKKGKAKKSVQSLSEDSHKDAVITLSLNSFRKNILCSGSADQTIKIWDISTQKCVHTYTHHTDKIQTIKWNQHSEPQLACASYDHKLSIFDARYSNTSMMFDLKADPESLIWNPFDQNQLFLSSEDGSIIGYDIRNQAEQLFNQTAHAKSATSITASSLVPGLMVTTGLDAVIKVWDYQTIKNNQIKQIAQRNVMKQAKKLYCGQFCVDSPFLVGCGTNAGEILIWDTSENVEVANHFLARIPENYKQDIINYLDNLKAQSKMEMEES